MKNFFLSSVLLLGLYAQANKPVCFEDKKEVLIPSTKFTLTTRGEVLNGTQKFANLPLPKGFVGNCLIAAPVKTDTLVILSMSAVDYDEKNAFIFKVSNKETKVLWSQHITRAVGPHMPFVHEKIIAVPTMGQVLGLNPDTGNVRWKFGTKETEGLDFKKFTLQGTSLHVEGSRAFPSENAPEKFEITIHDGKLVPPKKVTP